MTRLQFLAAEVFSYSFDNYANHLGIGHVRFERLMPNDVRTLERAEREGWDDARLAEALEVDISKVPEWRRRYRDAVEVVDAPDPAHLFRIAVRQVLALKLHAHNLGDAEIEELVTQICYRAADLSYVLKQKGEQLADYSEQLRRDE